MSAHKARAKRALPSTPGRFRAGTDAVERNEKSTKQASGNVTGTPLASKAFKRGKSVPEICFKAVSDAPTAGLDQDASHGLTKGSRHPSKEQLVDFSSNSARASSSPEKSGLPRRIPLKVEEGFPFINPEKKVARVLPMTPAFLENNTSGTFCDESNDDQGNDEDGCFSKMLDKEPNTKQVEDNKWGKPFEVYTFDEEASSVRVAVRLRPFSQRDIEDPKVVSCVTMKGQETLLTSPGTNITHEFCYDYSLNSFDPKHPEFVDQEKVYQLMGEPLLISAFQGFNTCLFAYGQTGSGKSYSIMGHGEEPGVLPRFCDELFERIKVWNELQFTVEISFFEIYNEKIHDLLACSKVKGAKKAQLKVREHPTLGPFVQDLSTYSVTSFEDVESWLAVGNRNRATAATGMNDKSSRSHSVFTILMSQTKTEIFEDTEAQMTKTSKMNLIDLAGSERASKVLNDDVIDSAETAALRLKEGGSINKSLHTLGKVISILSDRDCEKKKKLYIPYRDSVLTWLLKDSLGGNSKTAMIATISPASNHFAETLSTLRYAQRARTIVNKAMINEDPNAKLIRELRAEIERLKVAPSGMSPDMHKAAVSEIRQLRDKLGLSQKLLAESTRKWQEKLALTEKRKQEEAEKLKKAGISFKVDNKLPSLVNLNEDPQLSEMLLYILKEGESTVGRGEHDIQLGGALVAESHCTIKNEKGKITLVPLGDGQTYVNGQLVTEETVLHHADRVVIGGDHFFRLNHAIEAGKRRAEQPQEGGVVEGVAAETVVIKDFEFARNELAQVQNARLQAELEEAREEARIKAQEELMAEMQVEKEAVHQIMMEQKDNYEKRVAELQNTLENVSSQKQQAEQTSQSAEEQISQLQAHKMLLEQEILNNRKKLQMEAVAAKQALEETKMNQVRIVSELEKAKKKMQEDVLKLKEAKKSREKMREEFRASFSARRASLSDDPNKKELLRITMALREANKISQSLRKSLTFSRDDVFSDGKSEVKIRINNTKKGLTTLWNLEKFDSKLAQMRELYQQEDDDSVSGEECDPFASDPEDKWEKDFKMDSPAQGRQRSRPGTTSSPKKTNACVSKAESIFAKYRNPKPDSDSAEESGNTSEGPEPSAAAKPPVIGSLSGLASRTGISSSLPSSRKGSVVGLPISTLCRDVLAKSLQSTEDSKEPLHEIFLQSALELKTTVRSLKKNAQEDQGTSRETQALCFQATVTMTTLLGQSRMLHLSRSPGSGDRDGPGKDVQQAVKELLRLVLKITENLDKIWDPAREEVFTSFDQSLKNVVKHTARCAVLSREDNVGDGKIEDDDDLNLAFIEGQNFSLDTSFRQSLNSIDSIQENLEEDVINPDTEEVEREVSQNLLRLLKATADFVHQGQDLQTAFVSSSKPPKTERTRNSRLQFIKQFVAAMEKLQETVRILASAPRQPHKPMDMQSLLNSVDEIFVCTECATRHYRNFIESEYASEALVRESTSSVTDELEYFDEKARDIKIVIEDLKKMLKTSLLNPSR